MSPCLFCVRVLYLIHKQSIQPTAYCRQKEFKSERRGRRRRKQTISKRRLFGSVGHDDVQKKKYLDVRSDDHGILEVVEKSMIRCACGIFSRPDDQLRRYCECDIFLRLCKRCGEWIIVTKTKSHICRCTRHKTIAYAKSYPFFAKPCPSFDILIFSILENRCDEAIVVSMFQRMNISEIDISAVRMGRDMHLNVPSDRTWTEDKIGCADMAIVVVTNSMRPKEHSVLSTFRKHNVPCIRILSSKTQELCRNVRSKRNDKSTHDLIISVSHRQARKNAYVALTNRVHELMRPVYVDDTTKITPSRRVKSSSHWRAPTGCFTLTPNGKIEKGIDKRLSQSFRQSVIVTATPIKKMTRSRLATRTPRKRRQSTLSVTCDTKHQRFVRKLFDSQTKRRRRSPKEPFEQLTFKALNTTISKAFYVDQTQNEDGRSESKDADASDDREKLCDEYEIGRVEAEFEGTHRDVETHNHNSHSNMIEEVISPIKLKKMPCMLDEGNVFSATGSDIIDIDGEFSSNESDVNTNSAVSVDDSIREGNECDENDLYHPVTPICLNWNQPVRSKVGQEKLQSPLKLRGSVELQ